MSNINTVAGRKYFEVTLIKDLEPSVYCYLEWPEDKCKKGDTVRHYWWNRFDERPLFWKPDPCNISGMDPTKEWPTDAIEWTEHVEEIPILPELGRKIEILEDRIDMLAKARRTYYDDGWNQEYLETAIDRLKEKLDEVVKINPPKRK